MKNKSKFGKNMNAPTKIYKNNNLLKMKKTNE